MKGRHSARRRPRAYTADALVIAFALGVGLGIWIVVLGVWAYLRLSEWLTCVGPFSTC